MTATEPKGRRAAFRPRSRNIHRDDENVLPHVALRLDRGRRGVGRRVHGHVRQISMGARSKLSCRDMPLHGARAIPSRGGIQSRIRLVLVGGDAIHACHRQAAAAGTDPSCHSPLMFFTSLLHADGGRSIDAQWKHAADNYGGWVGRCRKRRPRE